MAVSAADIAQLRRMCALTEDDATYTDEVLAEYVARYPVPDSFGEFPYVYSYSTVPPTLQLNLLWSPTYDLHAAAARIWEEKAASYANRYDVNADGSNLQRSQLMQHALEQARYHRSRRKPSSFRAHKWPKEESGDTYPAWIVNAPEEEG